MDYMITSIYGCLPCPQHAKRIQQYRQGYAETHLRIGPRWPLSRRGKADQIDELQPGDGCSRGAVSLDCKGQSDEVGFVLWKCLEWHQAVP